MVEGLDYLEVGNQSRVATMQDFRSWPPDTPCIRDLSICSDWVECEMTLPLLPPPSGAEVSMKHLKDDPMTLSRFHSWSETETDLDIASSGLPNTWWSDGLSVNIQQIIALVRKEGERINQRKMRKMLRKENKNRADLWGRGGNSKQLSCRISSWRTPQKPFHARKKQTNREINQQINKGEIKFKKKNEKINEETSDAPNKQRRNETPIKL